MKPKKARELFCNFKFDSNNFECEEGCCYKDKCDEFLSHLKSTILAQKREALSPYTENDPVAKAELKKWNQAIDSIIKALF